MKIYLHFNLIITTNKYGVLFHNEDPINGHFELFLCKNDTITSSSFDLQKKILHKLIDLDIIKSKEFMEVKKLCRVPMFKIIYGESAFETIYYL
jgi:hypothetical protein